jgi:hypothetical protein
MVRLPQPSLLRSLLLPILVAGCVGTGGGSPAPSPLDLVAVTDALRSAGIAVVNVADNLDPRDGAWRCLPGSFRLARVEQQQPAAVARPGDRPSVDVLLFSSAGERAAAQASIGADGQVHTGGCGTIVDWVATPHVVGARNILLFIVTDDPVALADVETAGKQLGS